MNSDNINIFNLNGFEKISNKNIIIYFIIGLIILYIAKSTNNFSYVFIAICLMSIFIYYSQKISHENNKYNIDLKNKYMTEMNIDSSSLLARDNYLINLIHSARFIKYYENKLYTNLISYIEDFFVTYETLKQNINNIFLSKTDMIKPFNLNKIQHTILINDLRDQLERILKHIETIIFVIPNQQEYINSLYDFSQLIRSHLSRYYNRIMSDYKFTDHTSHYQLLRSSENKYDFIN
jgi:hypothetical protein